MEGITEDEYKRAQEMWDKYKCKNMQDFHDVYVKLDVVLLAISIWVYDESRHFQANLSTINVGILFKTQNGGYNRARVQKSPRDVG